MTMLDRMRRHKGWLKWSLALVVLAFIIFYIPGVPRRGDTGDGRSAPTWSRSVDGRGITVAEFQRAYQAQIQMYRGAYGGNISEQMLKQLGIDQQILQQMVGRAGRRWPRRGAWASTVSDAEVAQRILAMPGVPGERPVHRPGALRGAAADAAAADDDRASSSTSLRQQPHGREAAGRRSPTGSPSPTKDVDAGVHRRATRR